MSYTKRAVRGIGIVFFMNALAFIVAYGTRLVLARRLGPAEYGLFYAVFTFVAFFLFFRDLGLNQALTKYLAEFRVQKKLNAIKTSIFSVVFFQGLSSIIFGLTFFVLAPFLAVHYFKTPASEIILQVMVLYTLFSISFTILKNFFSGFQRFKFLAFVDFTKNSIILLLVLLFFSLGFEIFSPVFAYVLVGPLLVVGFLPFILKTFSFGGKIKNFRAISKKLFLFGLPVLVTDVGHKVISYIDTLVLTYFRPLSDVGVYNVVLPSAMALLFISTSISAVVFPVFAELWAKKDKQKLRDGLRLLHTYVFIAVAPIVFTLLAFSDLFIKLFFGKEYVAGAMALQILLVGVLFFVVSGINHSVISSIGYPKTVTKIVLAAAVVNAGVNFLLIPTYGIEGAAIATTLSYALALGLSTYASTRYIKTSLPVVRWLKTGVAALFFAGTVYFVKSVISLNPYTEAVIALGVAAVVYLGAIFFFKLVDIKELRFYGSLVFQKKGF